MPVLGAGTVFNIGIQIMFDEVNELIREIQQRLPKGVKMHVSFDIISTSSMSQPNDVEPEDYPQEDLDFIACGSCSIKEAIKFLSPVSRMTNPTFVTRLHDDNCPLKGTQERSGANWSVNCRSVVEYKWLLLNQNSK